MRQAIAKAMSRSNAEIPHYYLNTSINMSPSLHWLEELNAKRSIKERILPAAMLIRAIVLSLKSVPELNGFWEEYDGTNEHCGEKKYVFDIAFWFSSSSQCNDGLILMDVLR